MGKLFGGGAKQQQPAPVAPPAAPQIDDTQKTATLMRNEQDRRYMRGRASTVLTGSEGLPDLGMTSRPTAGGF